jgi:hypothetical protein
MCIRKENGNCPEEKAKISLKTVMLSYPNHPLSVPPKHNAEKNKLLSNDRNACKNAKHTPDRYFILNIFFFKFHML